MKDMPLMGLGTYIGLTEDFDRIDNAHERKEVTVTALKLALEKGYRHLDLATNYNNLPAVAEALRFAFTPVANGGLGLAREDLWLTMKVDHSDAIAPALNVLGIEYFDLLLIHHVQAAFNSEDKLVSIWRSLNENVASGKVKHIGVSNAYEPHLSRLLALCERESLIKPYANEIEINVMNKNIKFIQYCNEHQVKLIAYSPLGFHLSCYHIQNDDFVTLAKRIDSTPAQAILAWQMAKGITVIPKSVKEQHLLENFESQKFINSLKDHQDITQAIDKDFNDSEVTLDSAEAKEHGKSLTWNVNTFKYTL